MDDDPMMEPNYEYSDAGYPVKEPVSYFALLLQQPNKVRLINVGPELVSAIQERLEQLVTVESFGYVIFKDYLQTSFTGRFNIYDLVLEKPYFEKPEEDGKAPPSVTKEDMTLIKVAFCRILGSLFCYGYDVVVSSDLARDSMTHSSVFFRLRDPRRDLFPVHYYSHKFICVAPYGIDSILLINIPKVTVEPILKIIHLTWSPGIKSKQTLADDERSVSVVISLKLSGTPWNQAVYNSGKATIQARLIILEVARILSQHKWRFAANVNFCGTTDSFFFQWCPNLEMEDVRYCSLILSRYDRLRLLHVPSSLVSVIRECVNKQWYLQLLKQKDYHGTTELKLGGCPWWADGNDAVEARYFISSLVGNLKSHGWEVCGTVDLSRHNNDKSTFLLRQCPPSFAPHMCVSFNKANRIRLIVSSSEISEESELQLTTKMNEVIKQRWVALGPRNYGKSIEWKLEGEPWDTEGLYADHTRGVYLLCLLLEAIQPLGWRLVSSADVSSKNLDANERGYALIGKPEDMHTWFFLYDESMRALEPVDNDGHHNHNYTSIGGGPRARGVDMSASISVPNLDQSEATPSNFNYNYNYNPYHQPPHLSQQQHHQQNFMMYGHAQSVTHPPPPTPPIMDHLGHAPHHQCGGGGLSQHHSRSVPSVAAAVAGASGGVTLHGGGVADPYASRTSLNHEIAAAATSSSRPQSRSNHHSHICHQQNHHGGNFYQGQQQPCLANGRCQSRQRVLTRQASAGSLPPDHPSHQTHHPHHFHAHHHGQQQEMYSFDQDGGYKSDGEAYNHGGGSSMCYKAAARGRHNAGGGACQRPMRSLSGQLIPEPHPPGRGVVPGRNGYLSDGEGYLLQNQRISRSGKYGSQASSPRSDRPLPDELNDDEEDSEEDSEEELDENIEQEIHLNDLVAAKEQEQAQQHQQQQSQQPPQPPPSGADLIVSYAAFQAEAVARPGGLSGAQEQLFTVHAVTTTTETATVRRSNSNGCVVDGPRQQPQRPPSTSEAANGGQRGSCRSSRSNSRQGTEDMQRGSSTRGGGASSSQSDQRSDGGYRSDGWYHPAQQRSQPPATKRPDGYRSEGSTESPKHLDPQAMDPGLSMPYQAPSRPRANSRHRPQQQGMAGQYQQQQQGIIPAQAATQQQMRKGQQQPQQQGGLQHMPQQAPNCGGGGGAKHHHHMHMHHPHGGGPHGRQQQQQQQQQQQNLESCSTQSSSSSASGPPDYATCSGVPPPSYDQVSSKRHHKIAPGPPEPIPPKIPPHQGAGGSRRKTSRDQGNNHSRSSSASRQQQQGGTGSFTSAVSKARQAGTNELYYMGEFYG